MKSFLQSLKYHWLAFKFNRLRARHARRYRVPAYRAQIVDFGQARATPRGFTLIELMIVVAIVAILAAIALPMYLNYATKAKVAEGLGLAAGLQTAVATTYESSQTAPGNNAEAGYSYNTQGKYATVNVAGAGSVDIKFDQPGDPAAIAGSSLSLTPYTTTDGVTLGWLCGNAPVPTGWTALTPDAVGQGNPSVGTTIDASYLPSSCTAIGG